MTMTTHNLVQHPFTQRPLRVDHGLHVQSVEQGLEDSQPGRQDAPTLRLESFQVQPIHMAGLEDLALEPLQPLAGDLAVAQSGATDALADCADGTRCADRLLRSEER